MSTRANIIVEDRYDRLFFYRHSDGYPEGVQPTLDKFVEWLKSGVIRNNVQQGAGWLIVLGAIEYGDIPEYEKESPLFDGAKTYGDISTIKEPIDWKVGAYELTTGLHGDIEHLYVVNIERGEWREVHEDDWDKFKTERE